MTQSTARTIAVNVGLGLAYAIVGFITLNLGEQGLVELRQVIWIPSGIAIAVALHYPGGVWPGVLVGSGLVTALTGGALLHVIGTAVANGGEVAISVWLLNRLGFDRSLTRTRDAAFLMVGVAGGVVSLMALISVFTVIASTTELVASDMPRLWFMWWLTHAMGVLVLVPPLCALRDRTIRTVEGSRKELAIVMVLLVASAMVPFTFSPESWVTATMFLPFPFLVWAAVRGGLVGGAWAGSILSSVAMVAVIRDVGPFSGITPSEALVLTWGYANVAIGVGVLVGVVVLARERVRQDLEQGERRLRASEARFRWLYNNAPVLLHSLDENGLILNVNDHWLSVLGYEREDVVGKPFRDFVAQEAQIEAGAREQLEAVVLPYVREDGTTRLVSATAVPNPGDYEETGKRLVGGVDVTERLAMEAERHALERQVLHSQKLESLGLLAGGIAHDFNNLLATMMGFADLLETGSPSARSRQTYVAGILRAAERAAGLCRQMLTYTGRSNPLIEPLDLSDAARSIAELVKVTIPKGVDLNIELAREPVRVKCDLAQLQQVVMNLVTNAAEAIDHRHGKVTVRTGVEYLDRAWVDRCVFDGGVPGEYGVLVVEDNGVGMDAEIMDRIFDPFYSGKGPGRGLGLATTLGIVRGHKGLLRVDSRPGEGTVFRIALPLTTEMPVARPPRTSKTTEWSGLVLVADDEDDVRSVASTMLQRMGLEPIGVRDGLEAVQMAEARGSELRMALLDVTMPRMNGVDAMKRIRRVHPDLPIVLASGYTEINLPEGADGAPFVQKPFRMSVLRDIVADQLS